MPSISGRATKWVQTHTNQSYTTLNGGYGVGFFPTDGYEQISLHLKNDALTSASVSIDWSFDGVTATDNEVVVSLSPGTTLTKNGITQIKAPYCRIFAYNGDTVTHVLNNIAYLRT